MLILTFGTIFYVNNNINKNDKYNNYEKTIAALNDTITHTKIKGYDLYSKPAPAMNINDLVNSEYFKTLSANQQQLFNISYKNGSAQSYYEFSGGSTNNYTGTIDSSGKVVATLNNSGKGTTVGTTGSLLVLNPVHDFSLPSYLSSSSLGQYNLYFTINVYNQYAVVGIDPKTGLEIPITPEICIITVNSGIFTTQLGTSIINTGILTKEDVLRTKEEKPTMDTNDYKRFVGGSLMNLGASNLMKLFKNHVMPSDDKTNTDDYNTAGAISGGSSRISKLKKYMKN